MSLPSNGITADVIRDIMPPYHLSFDLLEGTFRALPPPPPDASAAWRQAHITRLIGEITTLKPADAGQARTASEILVLRELANTIASRAHAPDMTVSQLCRLGRAAAELARTADGLVRGLERTQQKPVPFYGTVELDEVDVAAVDQIWCGGTSASAEAGPTQRGTAPNVTAASVSETALAGGGEPARQQVYPGNQSDAALPVADDGPSSTRTPITPPPDRAMTETPAQPGRSADTVTSLETDARSTQEGVVTRLDQGPGWTLEVVRPQVQGQAGAGAARGVPA
jgi:hypothetical protein